MSEKLYPGTIMRSETVDGRTRTKRLPWQESVTRGEVGRDSRIIRKEREGVNVEVAPIRKRTPGERAEALAKMFVGQLQAFETVLGRPLVPEDLSDEWLRTFGLQFWRAGEPVTLEVMRQVAAQYLQATQSGSGADPRWAPSPVESR